MGHARRPSPWLALAGALAIIHALLGAWSIRVHSATFDEPVHIAAGSAFWKTGDLGPDGDHAPLARLWVTFPLRSLALRPPHKEVNRGDKYTGELFLYWSGNDADTILANARLMNLFLSLILAAALWHTARRRWGEAPAALSLALYVFSPNILAHASVAMTDLPAAFFATITILAFIEFLEHPSPRMAYWTAAAAFGAFLCKYSTGLLWPVFLIAFAVEYAQDRKAGRRKAALFARAAGVFWAVALPLYLLINSHAVAALRAQVGWVTHGAGPTFLLGGISQSGFPAYYAVAILAKSTFAELAVLAAAVWFAITRRPPSRTVWVPLITAGVFFAVFSLSRRQVGIRYILLLYPLIALTAAPLAAAALKRTRRAQTAILVCGLLQAVSAFATAPHFLAFFNAASGGSKNGHRILVDSNLDWGQELPALAEMHRRAGGPEVVLAYFGTAPAEYYGVPAQHLLSTTSIRRRHKNSDRPKEEWLAVSATHLEGLYVGRRTFAWLRKREPMRRLGHGLFVYDITRDADSHHRLAELYAAGGDAERAAHHRRRAQIIAGEAPEEPA